MKIERVNDHQIRCTLTKKELEQRNLKLSEIAYGNEKVKKLFQDMMQLAAHECDFDAEDTPLMIEIIPFSECAVIVVTKVEDPDELDTRFSRFAPSVHNADSILSGILGDVFQSLSEKHEGIGELFKKMQAHNDNSLEEKEAPENTDASNLQIFFHFNTLREVMNACHRLTDSFTGDSALYKNSQKNQFILNLRGTGMTTEAFTNVYNLLGEYGEPAYDNGYFKYFVKEHCEVIIAENAVNSLAGV
ncbi:MAG: adaptor protein MecA [Lachnospiraceae bacterium]|nr:adaptor protein MecA [Lachnospiraceae bacterium]